MDSRMRVRVDEGSWVVAPSDGEPGPGAVEVTGPEAILRAVREGRKNPLAMFLVGRIRVRGSLDQLDQLSRLLEEAGRG